MVGSNQDIPRTDSDDNSQPEWTGQANSASAAGASQKVSGANQNAPQSDQKSTMLELPKIIKVDPVKTEPSAERRSMDQKSTMLEMPAIKPNQLSPESPLTETQQDQKSTMLELPAVKAGYSTPTFEMPTAQTQQDQKSTMLELPVVGVKPDSDQRAAILEQSTMLELPAIKQDQRLAIPDAVAPQDQKSTMLELPAIKQDQRLAIRDAVAPQDQKSTMLELPAIKQDQRLAMSDAVAPQDQKSTMLELPKVRPGERPGASEQAAARQDQKSTMLEMPALKPDQRLSATEPTEPTQSTQPSTQINQQDQKSTMLERPPGSLQRTTNPEQKAIASDSRDPRDPRITNPNQPITNLNQAVQTDQRSTNQRTTNSNPSSNQRTINATPGLGNPNQRTTFNNQTTTGANQRTTNSNQRTTNEPGSLLNKTDSAARPKDSLAARVFARHTEAAEAVSIKKPLPEEVVETPAQESANPNSFANLADNVSVDTGGAWNEPIESVSSEFVRPAEEDAEAALWDKILETAAQAKAEAEAAAVAEAPEGAAPFWSRLVDPSNEAPGALEQKNSVEVLPDEEFDSSNNRPPASPKETLDEAIERERAAMRSNFPRTTGTTGTSRAASISQALERDKAWLDLKDKPDERVAIDSLLLESKPVDADEATLTHSEITKARTKAAKKLVAPKPTLMGNTMTFIAKHPIPFGVTAAVIVAVAGFFHWQSLQAANVQIEIGQKLLSSNPKKAIEAFDRAIALNRSASVAYLSRGKAYYRLGNIETAFENYKEALKCDPKNFEAAFQCANLSLARDQYKVAVPFFQQYVKVAPAEAAKSSDLYHGLARAYMGDGQFALAIGQFNKYLELKPSDTDAMLLRASCFLAVRKPGDAIIDCTRAINADHKNYDAYILRARGYQLANNKQKALADYAKAIAVEPKISQAYVSRGVFYASYGEFDHALSEFARAINVNSKDFNAYEERAKTYFLKGDKAKAEQEYEALSFRPGFKPDIKYFLDRSELDLQAGNYQKAIAELKKAQTKDGSRQSMYALKLADCYGAQKKYKQAVEVCNKVLETEPLNSDAVAKQGEYSYLSGNKITGKGNLFKAIQIDPTNANAYLLRGNYYFAEKQYGTALEDYKRALDLDPTLAAASTNLANCHDLVKQVKTTARTDEGARPAPAVSKAELKEVADSDARTLRTKGYEALKAGRDQFALLALNRSVQLEPNSALGRRYLAHALIATGDGTGAIQQFYNWEKLETVSATDAIAFARLLARAGDLSNAQLLFQHIISKHSTDTKAMLMAARYCSELRLGAESEAAIEAGMRTASEAEKADFGRIKAAAAQPEEPARHATPGKS